MDEFLILLQAKLDEAKSKENINEDIDTLQGKLNKLKLQTILDPKAAQSLANEIGKLVNQKIVISNIGVDTNQANKSGQIAGEEFNKGVSQGLNKSANILSSFKKSLQNIGMGSVEIDMVADRINNLGVQIESLSQTHSVGKKDVLSVNISGIDQYGQAIQLTQEYNFASGELIKAIDNVSTAQQKVGTSSNSLKKAESVFAEYSAKIAQFKSTNSNILSGLTTPLADFENKLAGLKNGNSTIDDVINSYKNLNAEASKITANLSAQFNKVDSAVRNIAKGSEAIASLKADFKGLANAPKDVNSELTKCEKLLQNVKNIELHEGHTANWSAAYKEWENSVDSLTAKLKVLKKEQTNVASTQVFKTSDLRKDNIAYMTKVSNTIDKQMAEIQKMSNAKGWKNFKVNGVEEADGKIKKLVLTITDAEGAIKKLNFQREKLQGNGKIQDGLMQTGDVQIIKTAAQAQEELASNTKKANNALAEQVHKIQLSIADKNTKNKNYGYQLDTEIKKLKDLGFTDDEVAQKVKTLTDAQAELKRVMDSSEYDSIISKNKAIVETDKERTVALNQVRTAYGQLKNDASQYYNLSKQNKLTNDILDWLHKNSNASNDAKHSLNEYYRELSSGRVSVERLEYIRQQLDDIDTTQRGLGRLGKSIKDQFSEAYRSFTQWLSVSSVVMLLLNQLRKMPKAVYEIDTAMTNLYKVTDETESKYVRFLDSAGVSASKLGRSISSLVEQTANWAKLGYSIDEASKLAEISSIYANVGEVDDVTAVSDIVTAMKAFNIEANNSITIVDSLNKLGNEFATDAKSLGEGLRNSASSMAVAGNDINQTLAILTGGGEITQNVNELSNGLRVVSMRLRGMKGALQEIGEEYEDIESISKIQTQIYDLTKGTVNIFKDDGTFKSTYDQLKEISEIYFDLSDSDRADLTEVMFGKNRANQGIAILQAFKSGQIQKAYETSVNSAGSAYEEQSRWLESLEAKTQQFEAAFQSLSNTIVDSDMLKDIVDLGTKGVSSLEEIAKALEYINSFGGNIKSTFGTLGAVSGILMNKFGIGERTMFQW